MILSSKHYIHDHKLLRGALLADLRAACGRATIITFRRDGELSIKEGRLPDGLALRVRCAIDWTPFPAGSVAVYVSSNRSAVDRAIEALGSQHSPAALAAALGVSEDSVRRRGVTAKKCKKFPKDTATLIAGLAAIRRREHLGQGWVAQFMSCSTATISSLEKSEACDEDTLAGYLRALVVGTRISDTVLRRQALEVGAALQAVRALPVPE